MLRYQNFAMQGSGTALATSGGTLVNVMRSYPGATITVYVAGTTTPITLYSTSAAAVKSNPFNADSAAYLYFYYNEALYPAITIQISGAGVPVPFTLPDVEAPSTPVSASTISVLDYGATGDGATDDRLAILAAFTAAAASASVTEVFFPPGTYYVSNALTLNVKSNLTFRGAGRYLSTIVGDTNGTYLFAVNASTGTVCSEVSVVDLGFVRRGSGIVSGISASGKYMPFGFRVERCYFYSAAQSTFLSFDSLPQALVRDCIFHGAGVGLATGAYLDNCGRGTRFEGNRFLYLKMGVIVNGTGVVKEKNSEQIDIGPGNYFDAGWAWKVYDYANSGGTVTYAAGNLIDSAATFAGITAGVYVRAMATLTSGTANFEGLTVTAVSGNFTGTRRGYILKSSVGGVSKIAIVAELRSSSILDVDEWLLETDRTPTSAPPNGSSYTLHVLVWGQVTSHTGTQINVSRWSTVDGITATPANGTRYEVSKNLAVNQVVIGRASHEINVFANRFRRSEGDQVSVSGDRCRVIDNTIEDGQDMGVTLFVGKANTVIGNSIARQGAFCITADGSAENIISGNTCVDSCVILQTATAAGAIVVQNDGATRNNVSGNVCERVNSFNMQFAVVVYAVAGAASENQVRNNTGINLVSGTTPFLARGASVADTKFSGNIGGLLLSDTGAVRTRTDNVQTQTYDPPSVADGAVAISTWSMAGILAGYPIAAALTTNNVNGVFIHAECNADGVATVIVFNKSGGPVDLASGTLTIRSMG